MAGHDTANMGTSGDDLCGRENADQELGAPDVFETSDHEDAVDQQNTTPASSRRSSIEVLESSPQATRQVFENAVLSSAAADFSDSISRPQKRSFAGHTVAETYNQRLARITRELEEMQLDEHTVVTVDPEAPDLGALLAKVRRCLSVQEPVPSPGVPEVQDVGTTAPQTVERPEISRKVVQTVSADLVADLHTRLSRLEKTIGYSDALEQNAHFSIQAMINDMYRQLNIVGRPEYNRKEVRPLVDALKRQTEMPPSTVPTGNVPMGERPDLRTSVDDRKIKLLHDKLLAVPDFETYLPVLVNKLKSLNTLNTELSGSVGARADLQDHLVAVQQSLSDWEHHLADHEARLDEMVRRSDTNREEVSKWVTALEQRLAEKQTG